ncbi:glycosyltransferase family 4 protein [uncultured Piscinibacter sp.]|uniref:glycosyltransferase family 4 protein n=1 Tax=uncultured Piscinibacter sp. TaxID=1131835 RepID=UPI00262B4D69|nr:glycosyltransferase family 4 protein [uncultured Piscinibacter sp.]
MERVAYVMNGFPRLSETFITHEIHQLERLGLDLRLYSVKQEHEAQVHPVVAAIRAPLAHLPRATSLSGHSLPRWLRDNLPAFWRDHVQVARRHPLRWAGALGSALALAWRHRGRDEQGRLRLRKVFVKEFLQAGAIAADLQRRGDVAHLHGHFCHGVATITWLAARMSGKSYSFTAHAKDIYQAELNPGDLLERKMHGARFVATCTCANADVLRARHPRPAEVHAIYHGLDTDWFRPGAQPAARRRPMILAVGRLVEKKGFDQLVEACARLRDAGLDFECRIVGEPGSASAAVAGLIAARGLGAHMRLLGPVTQVELREIYRQAHVFALPCQVMEDGDRDGFPNVLAEAMAMGVPVVSTAISGIPEMIDDGVHGLLVEPRDPAGLADALRRVLTDERLHAALAGAARERICERFDSRRTTVALRDLFVAQLQRASSHGAAARRREALS